MYWGTPAKPGVPVAPPAKPKPWGFKNPPPGWKVDTDSGKWVAPNGKPYTSLPKDPTLPRYGGTPTPALEAPEVPRVPRPGEDPVLARLDPKKVRSINGQVIPMDEDVIDMSEVRFRTELVDGQERTVASFRVTQHRQVAFFKSTMEELPAAERKASSTMRFLGQPSIESDPTKMLRLSSKHVQELPCAAYQLKTIPGLPPGSYVRMAHSQKGSYSAINGMVEIVVPSGSAEDALKAYNALMEKAKVGKSAMGIASEVAKDAAKKVRIMTQFVTPEAATIRAHVGPVSRSFVDQLWEKAVARDSTLKAVLSDLQERELYPGHHGYYSEKLAKMAKGSGSNAAQYIYHDTMSSERAAAIFQQGVSSNVERYKRGILGQVGANGGEDFRTGGANGVFMRVSRAGAGKYDAFWGQSGMRLIIDTDQLGRTDWWAYAGDIYGNTGPSTYASRKGPKALASAASTHSNEIMFPGGVPPSAIQKIVVKSSSVKNDIIARCKREGITSLNGVPLSKMIITTAESEAKQYIAGYGY
jgi:hypothetical protein